MISVINMREIANPERMRDRERIAVRWLWLWLRKNAPGPIRIPPEYNQGALDKERRGSGKGQRSGGTPAYDSHSLNTFLMQF